MTTPAELPEEQSAEGEFERQEDAFRAWVSSDGSTPHPAEPGRYHLYVSLACPWAHRTLIVRQLKELADDVGVTAVDPVRDERGWAFRDGPGHSRDLINGFRFLREAYEAAKPDFQGRWTVPVLWDKVAGRIVNNSEDDICRMFNECLAPRSRGIDLFPPELESPGPWTSTTSSGTTTSRTPKSTRRESYRSVPFSISPGPMAVAQAAQPN